MTPWVTAALLVASTLTLGARAAADSLPPVVLWAWERPEEFASIDPQRVGVAALVGTLNLSGPEVLLTPRLQPLALPTGTRLLPVVRIETDRARPPALSRDQAERAVAAILSLIGERRFSGVQIDFDATVSERSFYRALLVDLRRQLSHDAFISITALASWCLGDPWIHGLPVDEAVPMLFRMGVDGPRVRKLLQEGGDFRESLCLGSLGTSTDEPRPFSTDRRRTYVFHPRPWSSAAIDHLLRELENE